MNNHVGILRIIGLEMDCKVMRSIHTLMHHEIRGFHIGTTARLESHRADGQVGLTTSLQHLYIRGLLEPQDATAIVGDFDLEISVLAQLDVTKINLLLVYSDRGRAAVVIPTLVVNEECSHDHQNSSNRHE